MLKISVWHLQMLDVTFPRYFFYIFFPFSFFFLRFKFMNWLMSSFVSIFATHIYYLYQLLYIFLTLANFTYEYRLMDGNTPYKGRLEVRRNGGVWGTIYGFNWKSNHSMLACRSLGFSSALSASNFAKYGSSIGPVHSTVMGKCPLSATSIFDCFNAPWDNHKFIDDHRADVGLVCLPGRYPQSQHSNFFDRDLERRNGV